MIRWAVFFYDWPLPVNYPFPSVAYKAKDRGIFQAAFPTRRNGFGYAFLGSRVEGSTHPRLPIEHKWKRAERKELGFNPSILTGSFGSPFHSAKNACSHEGEALRRELSTDIAVDQSHDQSHIQKETPTHGIQQGSLHPFRCGCISIISSRADSVEGGRINHRICLFKGVFIFKLNRWLYL
jgi:hypothetical protein